MRFLRNSKHKIVNFLVLGLCFATLFTVLFIKSDTFAVSKTFHFSGDNSGLDIDNPSCKASQSESGKIITVHTTPLADGETCTVKGTFSWTIESITKSKEVPDIMRLDKDASHKYTVQIRQDYQIDEADKYPPSSSDWSIAFNQTDGAPYRPRCREVNGDANFPSGCRVDGKTTTSFQYCTQNYPNNCDETFERTLRIGHSLTVGPGETKTYCQAMTYHSSVQYTNIPESLRSLDPNNLDPDAGYNYTLSNTSNTKSNPVCFTVIGEKFTPDPEYTSTAKMSGDIDFSTSSNLSSCSWSNNGNLCTTTGDGRTTSYNVTPLYSLSREDEGDYTSPINVGCSTSSRSGISTTGCSGLGQSLKAGTRNSKVGSTVTVDVPVGGTVEKCFDIYWQDTITYRKVGTGNWNYDSSTNDGYRKVCIKIENPELTYITRFTANYLNLNLPSGITCNGYNCEADGTTETYRIGGSYQIKRTDYESEISKSTNNYRACFDSNPNNCSKQNSVNLGISNDNDRTYSGTINTESFSIPFNKTTTICLSLKYNNWIEYDYNKSIKDSSSSTTYKCYYFTNVQTSYATSFTGKSNGTLSEHAGLRRTNDNKEGTIENFPNSGNNTYTARFTHNISRNNVSAPPFTIETPKVKWFIEESINDGNYSEISGERGETTMSGLQTTATVYNKDVNVATLSNRSGDKGKYIKYCQRVSYVSSVIYTSNGGKTESAYVSSSPACVILKNPDYKEEERGERIRYMNADGTPSVYEVVGATKNGSTGQYNANDANISVVYNHTIQRTDTGFSESAPGEGIVFSSERGSMTQSITTSFYGSQTIGNNTANALCRSPFPNSTSGCNPYTLSLAASGSSWNSSAASGRTNSYLNNEDTANSYIIPAGETVSICQNTAVSPYRWQAKYVDIYRREVYYGNNGRELTNVSTDYVYNRTVLKSRSPELLESGTKLSDVKACADIHRDWNYKVAEGAPNSYQNEVVTAGQSLDLTFNIKLTRDDGWNDGIARNYLTGMNGSEYSIVRFTVSKNVSSQDSRLNSIVGGVITEAEPCNYYRNNGIVSGTSSCEASGFTMLDSRFNNNRATAETDKTLSLSIGRITIPQLSAGNKYCVALAITNHSSTNSSIFLTKPSCVGVGKRPTVHIQGGGVGSNGKINTSIFQINRNGTTEFYGSWTDLEIIAKNQVSGMSSGSGIVAKKTSSQAIPCGISSLTISNDECVYGHSLGYASYLGGSSIKRAIETRYAGKEEMNTVEGNLSLTRDQLGNYVVIHATGDITIKEDITLWSRNTRYTKPRIPQIILIADGNINIVESVGKLDTWLIAGGTIDTCTNENGTAKALSADVCNRRLEINAPIVAKSIHFNRTYGADYSEGSEYKVAEAAEVIDLNPAAYLFGMDEATKNNQPRTAYVRTTAPRY